MVYGLNMTRERVCLWNDLRTLFPVIGSFVWTLMVDFNVIHIPTERMVGYDMTAVVDFNNCSENINM